MSFQDEACVSLYLIGAQRQDPQNYFCAVNFGIWYNCRCHAEDVPDYIVVDDEVFKSMVFELYLRKGIIHKALLAG